MDIYDNILNAIKNGEHVRFQHINKGKNMRIITQLLTDGETILKKIIIITSALINRELPWPLWGHDHIHMWPEVIVMLTVNNFKSMRGCLVFTLDSLFIRHNMELNRNYSLIIWSQQSSVSAWLIRLRTNKINNDSDNTWNCICRPLPPAATYLNTLPPPSICDCIISICLGPNIPIN